MNAIIVTSDRVHEKEVRQALELNDGYCPCRIEKNKNTKCMCLDFRNQEEGPCHCGLYIKVKNK